MTRKSEMRLAAVLICACVGSILVWGSGPWGSRPVAASASPQVTVSISPNGHVVRLTSSDWKTQQVLDAQVDRFLEDHPELSCTSMAFNQDVPRFEAYRDYPIQVTLLCTKVGPP